ncbi:MAG: hypothetical protein QG623_546 [Patescibacteria group bacterium]|nr:hypothetical protein [Patescibacteria group bacterium]
MHNYNFLKDIEPKTTYQWHCYHVFEDEDFLRDLKDLEVAYQKYLSNPSPKNNKTPILQYIDKKFVLADKYKIKHFDLERFRNPKLNNYYGINHNVIDVLYDKSSDNIAVVLPLNIKKKEYIKAWELVNEVQIEKQVKKTKVKSTEKPDLVYAIFKARTSGESYRSIFESYQKESLNKYLGRPNQSLNTVDLLKQYYLRYRPKEVTSKDFL